MSHSIPSAFDAHCHLADPRMSDAYAVLARAREQQIDGILAIGGRTSEWQLLSELAAKDPHLWVGYGVHPWAVEECGDEALRELLRQLEDALAGKGVRPPDVLGEIGLDAVRAQHGLDRQTAALRRQLVLAREHQLPVVLHVVRAHQEMLALLRSARLERSQVMVHGFTGSAQLARQYVEAGTYISFGCAITDPARTKLREALTAVPDEHLLLETDAPDQTPRHRRPSLNEPAFLVDVIDAVAQLRGSTPHEVRSLTWRNALRFSRGARR